jgi:uroporphyrinogen-III synthase
MNVTTILIGQPEPTGASPYTELIEAHKLIIDFIPFIRIESISTKEFRAQRIDITKHTAVIFTTRSAVDMFFQLCNDLRVPVPSAMKYFCLTETISNYLQKYVTFRKRKMFHGAGTPASLIEAIGSKHRYELFLLVLPEGYKPEVPKVFDKARMKNSKAVFYRTVHADVSDVDLRRYDLLVFHSPVEVKSFLANFPKFKQGKTYIAAFGAATAKALTAAGLTISVQAPTPQAPSMAKALDLFLSQ